jgi:hypothetical protein
VEDVDSDEEGGSDDEDDMAEVFVVVEDELPEGAIEGADDWLHGAFPE